MHRSHATQIKTLETRLVVILYDNTRNNYLQHANYTSFSHQDGSQLDKMFIIGSITMLVETSFHQQ